MPVCLPDYFNMSIPACPSVATKSLHTFICPVMLCQSDKQILRDQPYSTSVDVYSFAIVMWEIAERKIPYEVRVRYYLVSVFLLSLPACQLPFLVFT